MRSRVATEPEVIHLRRDHRGPAGHFATTTGRLRQLCSLLRGITPVRPRPRRGSSGARSVPEKVDLDHVGGDTAAVGSLEPMV